MASKWTYLAIIVIPKTGPFWNGTAFYIVPANALFQSGQSGQHVIQ